VSAIRLELDEAKNVSNQRKHGVSFEAASEVFEDPLNFTVRERTKDGEQRWRTFGSVKDFFLLTVARSIEETQEDGTPIEIFRIISARHATPKERRHYEEENG
jgi:uncharacterized DUF497 family protein